MRVGNVLLKRDIAKAYDMVNWLFLMKCYVDWDFWIDGGVSFLIPFLLLFILSCYMEEQNVFSKPSRGLCHGIHYLHIYLFCLKKCCRVCYIRHLRRKGLCL